MGASGSRVSGSLGLSRLPFEGLKFMAYNFGCRVSRLTLGSDGGVLSGCAADAGHSDNQAPKSLNGTLRGTIKERSGGHFLYRAAEIR